ncbi:alpha/beta hydrolase [Endozoicomonas acroporae]|uniref:alpha/beta hydrolase n=1 Tax=Endozoicomonas acroporae TaxID=1701104 RepID=UPI003D7B1D40
MKRTQRLLLLTPLFAALAACMGGIQPTALQNKASDTNLQQHEEFRRGEVESSDQEHWYRELRLSDWKALGVTESDFETVLPRINSSGPLRDTITVYGPGQWTYEWTRHAEKVASQQPPSAQTAALLQRVSGLYLTASYPNLLSDHEQAALRNAVDYYVKAGLNMGQRIAVIDMPLSQGGSIKGLLHLPRQLAENDKKLPVILWTGGVDKTLVEHFQSAKKYTDTGYAVITFDIPGGGLNRVLKVSPGTEAEAHNAALAYVKNSTLLNEKRVAALSSSGGGLSLMEFTVATPELKAVVARCALVDGVLTQPEKLQYLPAMSVDSFFARQGLTYKGLDNPGRYTIPLSLKTKGYFDGKPHTSVPLLVINTKDDPVASPKDMRATAAMSSDSEIAFFGEAGHCPEGAEAENKIYRFITERI